MWLSSISRAHLRRCEPLSRFNSTICHPVQLSLQFPLGHLPWQFTLLLWQNLVVSFTWNFAGSFLRWYVTNVWMLFGSNFLSNISFQSLICCLLSHCMVTLHALYIFFYYQYLLCFSIISTSYLIVFWTRCLANSFSFLEITVLGRFSVV